MTEAEKPLSADELHAYVDDRLDAARRQQVERLLDSRHDLAREVAAYRAQRDALRSALAAPATEPVPPDLNLSRLVETRLRRRPPWWRLAATIALCLGLGGATGWYFGSAPRQDRTELAVSLLQQQAMASHTVYAADPRHPIEMAASDSATLAQWLSNRLHRSVVPPDLSGLGYKLLGGRLLATEHGGASALFVYQDASGTRLSLLLRPMAPELRADRADISHGSVNGCTWIANGMGYAVVASESDDALDQIADRINGETGKGG
jgi:anti-sigma factor RsiW